MCGGRCGRVCVGGWGGVMQSERDEVGKPGAFKKKDFCLRKRESSYIISGGIFFSNFFGV